AGTSLNYTLSGVTSSDILGGSLSGTVSIGNDGKGLIYVPIAEDRTTEGAEALTVTLQQGPSASTVILDTSTDPTYRIDATQSLVQEGASASFEVVTTGVAPGTALTYTLSGISAADVVGGALSGTVVIDSAGKGKITIPLAADFATESDETLTVTVQGKSSSVVVKDTSVSTPSYSVVANTSTVSEGSTASFTVSTTNVQAGTSLNYTLSGVTSSDIVGGSLSGTVSTGNDGKAFISVPIAEDRTTEGAEVLTVSLQQGPSASTVILDTSTDPTYAIAANSSTINEGETAVFTVTTTNVAAGTTLNYTISGVSVSDITGGVLSGKLQIGNDGKATINVPIAADRSTEGAEILTISLPSQGKSASVTIADTSADVDALPPKLAQSIPPYGSVNVPANTNLTLIFDETIQFGSGTISLIDALGNIFESFNQGSKGATILGSTLTLDPTNDLINGASFRVRIDQGGIFDLSGNA
ncbi:MAG: hypothetical protein EBZ53_07855, partial [Verrucomicrobia bacterium]|nr:hypothetical protein [Verrucomicrobiota bacterium]